MQLQEELSESDGSSSSSDDSLNDGHRSDEEIQSKAKGKSSKHSQGQGGGSKKNTALRKTHRNQSNLSSDDDCVIEVERKSDANKSPSSESIKNITETEKHSALKENATKPARS